MLKRRKTALHSFRKRQRRRGIVRVQLHLKKADAVLLRCVAKALNDPRREAEARSILRARFAAPVAHGLKALLASAPAGIDFERARDTGRSVEL